MPRPAPTPPTDPDADPLVPERILAEHGPLVWALCRRLDPDPEDAYQDVWAHLLPRLDRYDPDRGTLRAWLVSVAHRRLVDRHRRRRVRRVEALPEVADPNPAPDELASRAQRRARLEAALQGLPESQRRVVVAHHVNGRELDAIAADEQVALGTIKSRLHRGRARLLRLLGGG